MDLYNTLSHKVEEFSSIEKEKVGMYSCGPTVYNFAHIGNMRTYIMTDIIKRVLISKGYRVKHVMNITDVGHLVGDANLGEDKIRVTAEHQHKSVYEIAKFYTDEFIKDIKRLNLLLPDIMPKATDHINEMLELIGKLDEKGYLYTIKTGVYYDTSKFKNYGQLMGLSFEQLNDYLISGARVERAAGIKNTTDFAVWRFSTPEQKDMVWDTKYGKGFPGWHIECSAMSMKYLGETFDIHTGGVDHLPIHHTNEIVQSESATGKKFVNYWLHVEFLQVNGKKMSKSLGNVFTLQDIIDKGYSINGFKYLIISAYYRTQLNFTFEALDNSENTLKGIYAFIKRLSEVPDGSSEPDTTFAKKIEKYKDGFYASMENDINTSLALAKMHGIISETNKIYEKEISKKDAEMVIETLIGFDKILALGFSDHLEKKDLPEGAKELIDEREKARKDKNFKEADRIRAKLRDEFGIELQDTDKGPSWHKR